MTVSATKFGWKLRGAIAFAMLLVAAASFAEETVLNKSWNEEVVLIENKSGLFTTKLEATLFRPFGDGPFPLVVINHGKAPGNPRFQDRARYPLATREFVKRGYVVMMPMRGGFSRSSGSYIAGGCNLESNGVAQADDVRVALDYATTLPYVDRQRIVVMGQSHGGLTTMAFGTQAYPGVRGLVNFAGGLRLENCSGWEGLLVRTFGAYGAKSKYPSLWFYGDNDSYWPKETIGQMYAAYVGAGGMARLVAFGVFKGGDAHAMFARREGLEIWLPEVEKFLAELGLPTQVLPRTVENDPVTVRLQEAARSLTFGDRCQTLFQSFLDADYPRAFAVAGARCGFASGPDSQKRAIEFCQGKTDTPCKLFAVNDAVVEGL
jgi:dienelactone hydrolase